MKERLEIFQLFAHILSSIRELNKRICELKWVVKEVAPEGEKKQRILKRIENLNNTRMCLIYSMYDVRKQASKALSMPIEISTLYKELKDL